MANRRDFFFKQPVTEAELDNAFSDLEDAERNILKDLGVLGVLIGGVVTEDSPADLTVDISGPMLGRNQSGERLSFTSLLNVDLAVDGFLKKGLGGTSTNGVSTAVVGGGNDRILSLFMKFDRFNGDLVDPDPPIDPRTDGLGNPIEFEQPETFRFVIIAGTEGAAPVSIGTAPSTPAGHIRLADIRLAFGVTQIFNADIITTNRIEALSDWADLSSHILDTQDPHSANMTITEALLLGAAGAPPGGGEVLGVVGTAGEFIQFRGTNGQSFLFDLDAVPLLDILAGTGITGVEQSYFRVREGGGLLVYLNARGILGATSGTGNGTRMLVDETNKRVEFFSGTEAARLTGGGWDVELRASQIDLTTHGSGIPTGKVDINPIGNQPRIDVTGQTNTNVDDYGIKSNELIGAQGFADAAAIVNGVRIKVRDSLRLVQIGSGAAGSTFDVPVQADSFEPKQAHNDIALSAAQLPQLGEGRIVLVHGTITGSTGAIQAGHVNVATPVRNGTGDYTINFDTAISHTTYSVFVQIEGSSRGFAVYDTRGTSNFNVKTFDSSDVAADRNFSFVVIAHP